MFQRLWPTIRDEVSGAAAARAVAEIARFHRIQASPGFRQAAEWVCQEALRAGLSAGIISFPADGARASGAPPASRSGRPRGQSPPDRARRPGPQTGRLPGPPPPPGRPQPPL